MVSNFSNKVPKLLSFRASRNHSRHKGNQVGISPMNNIIIMLVKSTNLARAFRVFIFESRHTINFTATVIVTVQNTLPKSLTGLTQTSIQVVIVRIILKKD